MTRIGSHEVHPCAEAFPMMDDTLLGYLAADIKEYGLMRPIVLLDGLILDGRNRYAACIRAGIEPRFRIYDGDTDSRSLALYVMRENLMRRDLTPVQRALCMRRLVKTIRERKERALVQKSLPIEADHTMGQIAGCSPKVMEAVFRGDVSADDARGLSQLSHEEQHAVLDEADKPVLVKPPAGTTYSVSLVIELSFMDLGALNALAELGDKQGGQFRAGAKLLRKMVPGV